MSGGVFCLPWCVATPVLGDAVLYADRGHESNARVQRVVAEYLHQCLVESGHLSPGGPVKRPEMRHIPRPNRSRDLQFRFCCLEQSRVLTACLKQGIVDDALGLLVHRGEYFVSPEKCQVGHRRFDDQFVMWLQQQTTLDFGIAVLSIFSAIFFDRIAQFASLHLHRECL